MTDVVNVVEAQPEPRYPFEKALDSRGNPIEGLWIRNGRFYGQLYIPGKGTRRFALKNERGEEVANTREARAAFEELRGDKRKGQLPTTGRAPFFPEFVKTYLEHIENRKKLLTVKKERSALGGWQEHLGQIRLNQITLDHIKAYTDERLEDGKNNRTVNLDVAALSNILKFAKSEGWLRGDLPTARWGRLKENPKKQGLFTNAQLDALLVEALRKGSDGKLVHMNGEMLADWLKLMAYSGARRQSALSVAWADVDFKQRQLHLRRNTKLGKHIVVDFNAKLEAHLQDMHNRRSPDSDFLFPGRWETRGEEHACNMQKTLADVREKAGFPEFTPHLLRHSFISHCVMDGIDFMTIAKWVGHADNGILIAKVYAHLANEHLRRSADKVTLGAERKAEPSEIEKLQAKLDAMSAVMDRLLLTQKTNG